MTRDKIEQMANDFWRARGMKRVIFEDEAGISVWSDFAAEVAAKVAEEAVEAAWNLRCRVTLTYVGADTTRRGCDCNPCNIYRGIRALSPGAKEQD